MVLRTLTFFAVLFFLLVAGCSSVDRAEPARQKEPTFAGDSAVVAKRVKDRWEALVKQDLDLAWTFISPAGRVAFPLDVYKSRIKPLEWKAVDVKEVTCEGERCAVILSLALQDVRVGQVETIITETWVKENGAWWFVYRG